MNDYVIKYSKDLCKTRLFVIFYERSTEKYYFRNLNDIENETKSLIYIKMTVPYKIKKKHYFQIGQTVFQVDPNPFKQKDNSFIKIVIHQPSAINNNSNNDNNNNNPNNDSDTLISKSNLKLSSISNQSNTNNHSNKIEYLFDKSKSPIKIGRRKNTCHVHIDSSLLSKVHCVLNYNNDSHCWEIYDGDGTGHKPSTNGTWLWINSKFEINEEITFVKMGNNIIKISMY
jgi:hypothetical protein